MNPQTCEDFSAVLSEADKCSECETQLDVPDDAATVASSSDCRTRSRLVIEDHRPCERRSVTFDLPELDGYEDEQDDQSCGHYDDVCAAERAEQAEPTQEHAARAGLVRTHEKIFIVPGVDCLGCLLGHGTLKPVVNALRRSAAFLEEPALLATAHAAYEEIRAKCRLEGGLLAPEWSTQGIRLHFWQHALDPVLEAIRLARRLDEVQSVLMEEVERCAAGGDGAGGGPIPTSTLGLLQRVSAAQAKQHAWLQKLLAACESDQHQQQDGHRTPIAGPAARVTLDRRRRVRRRSIGGPLQARVVPTPSAVAATTALPPSAPSTPVMPPPRAAPALATSPHTPHFVPPTAPPPATLPRVVPPPPTAVPPAVVPPPAALPPTMPPPAMPPSAAPSITAPPSTQSPPAAQHALPGPCFLDEPEGTSADGCVRAAASMSPEPGPVQTAMDTSVAKAVLRDFLSSLVQPCVPPSAAKAAKVQRTLAEAWQGAATSDVLVRSRGDDLCRYQEERRCACAMRKGSREGCSFAIDRRFETQLAAFSPAARRFYVAQGMDTLLDHLRDVLQIPAAARLRKRSDQTVTVYGWSLHTSIHRRPPSVCVRVHGKQPNRWAMEELRLSVSRRGRR